MQPPEWITNLVTEFGIHKPEYPFLQLMDAYGTMVPDRILTKAHADLEEEGMLEEV